MVPFQREMQTGLELAFQVQPPSAVINVRPVGARRGTVIGRAGEYAARGRRAQTYSLPEPGDYFVTLHSGGGEYRVLVHAAAGGPPATITWTFPGGGREMTRRRRVPGAAADPALLSAPRLPGRARVERLANGLTVCLLENRQAPLVTSALWYRAGTRDEDEAHLGAAHFLEHMMFKGSRRYGPGEIDRRTQALGGTNNAFTSHDSTAYYFSFASDRWREALDIEADRMRGLLLDPQEVASERQVIQEEIAMYEDDPWDALEIHALREFFGGHPYGRPVLGTRETVAATGVAELARFHREFYRPANAVLVVAGDVGPEALDAVEAAFADLGGPPAERVRGPRGGVPPGLRRLERRHGEVPRMLLALPAPPGHPRRPRARCASWWRCSPGGGPAGCTRRWSTRGSWRSRCRRTWRRVRRPAGWCWAWSSCPGSRRRGPRRRSSPSSRRCAAPPRPRPRSSAPSRWCSPTGSSATSASTSRRSPPGSSWRSSSSAITSASSRRCSPPRPRSSPPRRRATSTRSGRGSSPGRCPRS